MNKMDYKLCGFYNHLNLDRTFITPIFLKFGKFFIQIVSCDNFVQEFQRLDLDDCQIDFKESKFFSKQNSPAIFAFKNNDFIIFGEKEELSRKLYHLKKELDSHPIVLLEVLYFINGSYLEKLTALNQMKGSLKFSNESIVEDMIKLESTYAMQN